MSRSPALPPLPTPSRVVIVGAGVSGTRCAFALRERGYTGSITLLGAEPRSAYDRTLLSKDFLGGEIAHEQLALHAPADYAAHDIDQRIGTEVTSLEPRHQRVVLTNGTALDYDRLVLATGSRAARPAALDHPGVHVLRDLEDAARIRRQLATCRRIVIVGGGFIGCELAATASSSGINTVLVEADEAPLARLVGPQVAQLIGELHTARGVHLRTGRAAVGVRADRGGQLTVSLADGSEVAGDTVVLGAGSTPIAGLGPNSGTAGIPTDARCRTAAPNVLAAGDCARWFHPGYRDYLRVEHWDTARRHGAAAAGTILGANEPFAPIPFFWSHQYGTRLQWVGHAPVWDSVNLEPGTAPGSFVARYHHGGRFVAALAANDPRAVAAARTELASLQQEEAA
ncbi:FAD-dependent oxidoreductase [Salinifilum aidingensis]